MGQSGRALRGAKNELSADDVKKQVDSDDNHQLPIYQLVNVKNGGGKLVDIIKTSARHSGSDSFGIKSTDFIASQGQLDSTIHNLVEPLLYNKGRGKLVHMSRLWMSRFGKTEPVGNEDTGENMGPDSDPSRYRWVCWKLEERGFVGETGLHICFLLSTPTHMILARKLLAMFPMLINDIYTNDMYFGESSLHMAIVNEDVRIVKLLLDHGANVHERCLGSFFLPTDQKDKANSNLRRILDRISQTKDDERNIGPNSELDQIDLQSNQFNDDTNYDGYAYWGEYPLSFAACLGLSDCYKLLLAHGANPNLQDSNKNSTLHMAVIADRMDMFDLCYSNGANLNLVNKQNLSPLTLAAKLRRVDIFFHILTIQRQVNWIFCNVGFVDMPLNGVDSINTENGSCNDDSVLSIVVFGGSNEHLQMLNGLLSQLLKVKWETASRGKFYAWLYQFLLFLLISTVAYVTRFDRRQSVDFVSYADLNTYSEYALVLFVVYYLWIITQRIIPLSGLRVFSKAMAQSPEISMFIFTCLLILCCVPLRLLGWQQAEDLVAALVMFTLPLKILFFCRASRSVGSFVVMIHKILLNDVLCFAVFLIIFVAGFSQSFLIIFKTHRPTLSATNGTQVDRNYFVNLFDGIISMHMMALNEFGTVFDELDLTDYPKLAKVFFCVYMVLVSILLINMLIAMLGKTYQDIASQPNESLRQWARTLLLVERMWTDSHRLKMLDKYSHAKLLGSESISYYGSTWPLTQKDHEQINRLNRLKAENTKHARRLARV